MILYAACSKMIYNHVWRKLWHVKYLKNDLGLSVSLWEYRISGFALDFSLFDLYQ